MEFGGELARVRALSDGDLLASLEGAVGVLRRSAADVVAHLGEVEERRLHLLAGYSSMFAYCLSRLGMSEDEAWRRMEVARLARRFPRVLEMLADGGISLSVAALLRRQLTDANCEALLAQVSGKTVSEAREVLARWFPRADVPSFIRKLPTRQQSAPPVTVQMTLSCREEEASPEAPGVPPPTSANCTGALEMSASGTAVVGASPLHAGGSVVDVLSAAGTPLANAAALSSASRSTSAFPRTHRSPLTCASPRTAPLPLTDSSRSDTSLLAGDRRSTSAPSLARPAPPAIRPLSPERYRIQLLASGELKRKLLLARDLLRHSMPSAGLPEIVERALDVLLEQTMKRRFATKPPASTRGPSNAPEPSNPRLSGETPSTVTNSKRKRSSSDEPRGLAARYIPRDVRRSVIARDGVRCTWRGSDGKRCNCRAWLELDHIIPRSLGGSNDPANVRLLCRFHNRLAAEQAFGRHTIVRIVARRRHQAPSAPERPDNPDEHADAIESRDSGP